MSESNAEPIQKMLAEREALRKELSELVEEENSPESAELDTSIEAINKRGHRHDRIRDLQNQISQKNDEITVALLGSMVKITKKLEKSSNRLDLLTSALLLLTALLLYFAAAPYLYGFLKDQGTSPSAALFIANAASLLIVAMVFVPLTIMAYRRGHPTKVDKRPNDGVGS